MKPQLNSWAAFEMWKFSLSTPTVVPGYSLSTRNSASSSLRRRLSAAVASNDTALAQAAVSGYFIRRVRHFGQRPQTGKHWLKWLDVVDVERQPILAQQARQAPWNDYATWPVLIASTHQDTPLGCVLAAAEIPLQTQPYLPPGATPGSQRHPGPTPLYLQ